MNNKFLEKIRLYGLVGGCKRLLKAILRRTLGISWEKCLLMSRTLEAVKLPQRTDLDVRLLTMNDFDTPDWSEFMTESKRTIYRKRFLNPKAKAYGVFIDGHLAYSTWILYGEVTYSDAYTLLKDSSCALLLDSYCHSDFRGNGLHNFMNQWCLEEMQRNGVKKAYVIILAYNTPALKTQKKCGLTVERTFYSYTFRNKFTVKF